LDVLLTLSISIQLNGHARHGAVVAESLEVRLGGCAPTTIAPLNHYKDGFTSELPDQIS